MGPERSWPHLRRSAQARWGAAARAAHRPGRRSSRQPARPSSGRCGLPSVRPPPSRGPARGRRAAPGRAEPFRRRAACGWAGRSSPPAPASRRSPPTAARGSPLLRADPALRAVCPRSPIGRSTPAPPRSLCAAHAPSGCSAALRTPPPSARSPRQPAAPDACPARSGAAQSPRGFRAARRPHDVATRAGEPSPSLSQ